MATTGTAFCKRGETVLRRSRGNHVVPLALQGTCRSQEHHRRVLVLRLSESVTSSPAACCFKEVFFLSFIMKLRIHDCGGESSQVTTPNKWATIEFKSAKVSQAETVIYLSPQHDDSRYTGCKSDVGAHASGQTVPGAPCRHAGADCAKRHFTSHGRFSFISSELY